MGVEGYAYGCSDRSDPSHRVTLSPMVREVSLVTRMLIRVDGDVSEQVSNAFPQLTSRTHRAQTTLTGDVVDQEELQGVLSYLHVLGIPVLEIVTIPED